MTQRFNVWIPGKPLAQARARGRALPGGGVQFYDPAPSRQWKKMAGNVMYGAMREQNCSPSRHQFCGVDALAIWPCPKGEQRKGNPPPRRWYNRRGGDADNVAKAILDAGNGIVWPDDSCVVDLRVRTIIGAQGEEPGVDLFVYPVPEDEVCDD